jgi:hypothetical protein
VACSCSKKKPKYVVEHPSGTRSSYGSLIEATAAAQATGGTIVSQPQTVTQ